MKLKKSKYKEYGLIYSEQCVNCSNEGTYHCALQIKDSECLNFKSVED